MESLNRVGETVSIRRSGLVEGRTSDDRPILRLDEDNDGYVGQNDAGLVVQNPQTGAWRPIENTLDLHYTTQAMTPQERSDRLGLLRDGKVQTMGQRWSGEHLVGQGQAEGPGFKVTSRSYAKVDGSHLNTDDGSFDENAAINRTNVLVEPRGTPLWAGRERYVFRADSPNAHVDVPSGTLKATGLDLRDNVRTMGSHLTQGLRDTGTHFAGLMRTVVDSLNQKDDLLVRGVVGLFGTGIACVGACTDLADTLVLHPASDVTRTAVELGGDLVRSAKA